MNDTQDLLDRRRNSTGTYSSTVRTKGGRRRITNIVSDKRKERVRSVSERIGARSDQREIQKGTPRPGFIIYRQSVGGM